MATKIEVEQKFFCKDPQKIKNELTNQGFKIQDEVNEEDEYFTDIDCEYVKNRTCLRIRKKNDSGMELTFKGKSQEYGSIYAKSESNLELNINEYGEIVNTLKALGYYSYSIVNKGRKTYSQKKQNREYNVMIDEVSNIGCFVEFEILCEDIYCDTDCLKKDLNDFVDQFKKLNFESADLPYRDFVALHLYQNMLPEGELRGLIINLDSLLKSDEKVFHDFQELANKDDEQSKEKYEIRFKQLILNQDVLLNFELLKRVKKKSIKLGLISTIRKEMVDTLISDLKIENLFDIISSQERIDKPELILDVYKTVLERMQIESNNAIIVENYKNYKNLENKSNIKTIYVDNASYSNNKGIIKIDCFSRIAFLLINYLD